MHLDAKKKNILMMVAIPVFGVVLLNLMFLFDCFVHMLLLALFEQNINSQLMHVIFLLVIAIISVFVYRSKIKEEYKEVYTVVPIAVALITIWILLYTIPLIAYIINAIILVAAIYLLHMLKKPWQYYYAIIFVYVLLIIMQLVGIDI